MKQQIIRWIGVGGTLAQGVALLKQAGGNAKPFEPLLLRAIVNPAQKEKLKEALRLIAATMPDEAAPAPEKGRTRRPTEEPGIVQEMRARGKRLLKERAMLRGRLMQATTDEDRYELARRIMEEVSKGIHEVYSHVRAYEKTGAVPMVAEADIMQQAVTMFKRRESLRGILARQRRNIPKMEDGPEKMKAETELAALETEYADLNTKLGI